jgi:hypothetical protein
VRRAGGRARRETLGLDAVPEALAERDEWDFDSREYDVVEILRWRHSRMGSRVRNLPEGVTFEGLRPR